MRPVHRDQCPPRAASTLSRRMVRRLSPCRADYHTGQQQATGTGQPIDLYRGNQLAAAMPGKPFFVADENEHKTWVFTPTNEGTLLPEPRLFARRGEAGVIDRFRRQRVHCRRGHLRLQRRRKTGRSHPDTRACIEPRLLRHGSFDVVPITAQVHSVYVMKIAATDMQRLK